MVSRQKIDINASHANATWYYTILLSYMDYMTIYFYEDIVETLRILIAFRRVTVHTFEI